MASPGIHPPEARPTHPRVAPFSQNPLYLRLTWKCEVGAQLGLKRLIWG